MLCCYGMQIPVVKTQELGPTNLSEPSQSEIGDRAGAQSYSTHKAPVLIPSISK